MGAARWYEGWVEPVQITPLTDDDQSWDGSPSSGTPFTGYVVKLAQSQAYRDGRPSTTSQYQIGTDPPSPVSENQRLDVPGEGRMKVQSVLVRDSVALLDAEKVA